MTALKKKFHKTICTKRNTFKERYTQLQHDASAQQNEVKLSSEAVPSQNVAKKEPEKKR